MNPNAGAFAALMNPCWDLPIVPDDEHVLTALNQLPPKLRYHALSCPRCLMTANLTVFQLLRCINHRNAERIRKLAALPAVWP